jgi:hypothetical protein
LTLADDRDDIGRMNEAAVLQKHFKTVKMLD